MRADGFGKGNFAKCVAGLIVLDTALMLATAARILAKGREYLAKDSNLSLHYMCSFYQTPVRGLLLPGSPYEGPSVCGKRYPLFRYIPPLFLIMPRFLTEKLQSEDVSTAPHHFHRTTNRVLVPSYPIFPPNSSKLHD